MTTSLRGRALLEAALDRITNPGPDTPRWHQAVYRRVTPDCGTLMCLAGHVADLVGVRWMGDGVRWTGDDDDVDPSSVPTDLPPGDVHHVARHALGWDESTAVRVFVYYPPSLRDPERFAACVRWLDEHRDATWDDALDLTEDQ